MHFITGWKLASSEARHLDSAWLCFDHVVADFLRIHLCLCLWLRIYMYLSVYYIIYIHLYPSLSICIHLYPSVGLSVCRSVGLSVCRSVCLSVCLSVCPSIYLPMFPSFSLFFEFGPFGSIWINKMKRLFGIIWWILAGCFSWRISEDFAPLTRYTWHSSLP